jgi:hypothetical protein
LFIFTVHTGKPKGHGHEAGNPLTTKELLRQIFRNVNVKHDKSTTFELNKYSPHDECNMQYFIPLKLKNTICIN